MDYAGVTATEAAAKHLLAYLKKEGKAQPIRLSLEQTKGCGDFSPTYEFGAAITPNDIVNDCFGLRVVCDMKKFPELADAVIDVEDNGAAGYRIFIRTTQMESCGCGKAYTPKKG